MKKPPLRDTLPAARSHILIQGEMAYAANHLQEAFFEVFTWALALERPDEFGANVRFQDHALAMWHVIQSDISQRELAIAAITSVPSRLPLLAATSRLKWARARADKIAQYRNIAVHSPVMFWATIKEGKLVFVPGFGGLSVKKATRDKLRLIKRPSFWKTVRDDLLKLSDYVRAVTQQIFRLDSASRNAVVIGVPKSWPGKPRLRSLSHLQAIDSQLSAAALKSKPPRPRRSSRRKARKK